MLNFINNMHQGQRIVLSNSFDFDTAQINCITSVFNEIFTIMDTSLVVRKLVIQKYLQKLTQSDIAQQLNVCQSTVSRLISRYKSSGTLTALRKGKCGRKRLLSARTDRLLARASKKNPRATAADIQKTVGGDANMVSLCTIKRSLRRSDRLAYRPNKSPQWNASQMRVRLQWCLEHRYMSIEDWKKVS